MSLAFESAAQRRSAVAPAAEPTPSPAPPLAIAATLAGERLFITGATGFIGKVLVEKLLWSVPEVGRLLLLVRAADDRTARERLRRELFDSPVMARLRALHGAGWERFVEGKVEAVAGDLGRDRFGLAPERYEVLCRGIDRVVGAAATVRFDERLDRALETNVHGARRTLELARDAGGAPLVHVSTCFVSGPRQGPVWEEIVPLAGSAEESPDPDACVAELDEACGRVRATGSERTDADWVAAGAEQAGRHGFHDVYTLTKALAERLVDRHRGAVPVAVVRPAIVESAATEPFPGWIEGVRVADPILVAYGRGLTRDLPGAADAPLDLVPVDLVVNAMLAALAGLDRRRPGLEVFQLSSSRHPVTLGELIDHAREGFGRAPLRDEDGDPIAPRRPRFVEPARLRRELVARRRGRQRPGLGRRALDHFVRLIDVYSPYLGRGARYQDLATRALWDRVSPAERDVFRFDVEGIDWRSYIADVHVPGLVRFALRAESGAPPASDSGAVDPGAVATTRRLGEAAAARANRARDVYDLFRSVAEAAPERVAFQTHRDGRWLRYTYGQALTTVHNVARRLATDHGIGHGDRVGLWAGGGPEWVLTMLALHRLGAVSVPLDPQWPVAEIEDAARFVDAKLICAAPALAARLADSAIPTVELAEPFVPAPEVGPLPGSGGARPPVAPGDLATLVFTSGTTVAPKAVALSHENLLANVRDLVPLMELSRERLLSVLPIHHVFELMVGLLVPMAGASTVSYVAEIKPAEIAWMMNSTRPTVLVAVPRLLELLHGGIFQSVAAGGPWLPRLFRLLFALSRLTGGRFGHRLFAKVHRRFGGSLRRIATGGSALDPELGRSFQLMGFRVAEGYGLTETSPVLTVNPWRALRFGSVGRPLPGVEVDIRPLGGDESTDGGKREGGSGEGEIWVRGANVMGGYYRAPEATAEAIKDGWLDTGDLGYLDGDGYLYVSGRGKDVIVTAAGKNVFPEEVERRYRDLPGVAELVVLGLPAAGGGGERVAAVVVPAAADEAAEEGIRAAIDERSAAVPSYQRIGPVEIWRGELPKTTTLKVRRLALRQALVEKRDSADRGVAAAADQGPSRAAVDATAVAPTSPRSDDETWILTTLAGLTGTRPEQLVEGVRLSELGVDSLTRVELVSRIEERFGLRLPDEAIASVEKVRDLLALDR